jgi:hypothetical protein
MCLSFNHKPKMGLSSESLLQPKINSRQLNVSLSPASYPENAQLQLLHNQNQTWQDHACLDDSPQSSYISCISSGLPSTSFFSLSTTTSGLSKRRRCSRMSPALLFSNNRSNDACGCLCPERLKKNGFFIVYMVLLFSTGISKSRTAKAMVQESRIARGHKGRAAYRNTHHTPWCSSWGFASYDVLYKLAFSLYSLLQHSLRLGSKIVIASLDVCVSALENFYSLVLWIWSF